jgi:hypothetical protein
MIVPDKAKWILLVVAFDAAVMVALVWWFVIRSH